MKFFIFFLFILKNGFYVEAELHAELSGEVTLHFLFDPFYNYHSKSCSKLTSVWLPLVDNKGYVHRAYKGRIEINEFSGGLNVRIWNLHDGDAGIYRCWIHWHQNYITYEDFRVVLADKNPKTDLFPKSTISPVTSLHHIARKHQEEEPSDMWSLRQTLGTVFGVVIAGLIMSVVLAVLCYKKKKRDPAHGTSSFSSDKCGSSLTSSLDIIPEPECVIYTTVDFKPHEETSELYANLCLHKSSAITPESGAALKSEESVEYATIARHL